ncbi:hypothetical protein [[Flexibacter] sp. ATCC 35208]|uniref:hypothetical protein n=1 Tax=[Flexibacter] sp. ATCC 35208 TaxID=1936242 RepID=UPI0009C5CDA0|nr:hypothetical protein [[Flexibacter] sp. ATCC 35208]OMP74689.1 hypothetical protein BW716_34080 [[Flexibacter] sp. ATCC 35208]
MWKKIVLRVLDGDNNIPSPFDKDGIMKYVFVLVDEINMMGFLLIWCSKTTKGINISRLKIPSEVKYLTKTEFEKFSLPVITYVDPSENGGGL